MAASSELPQFTPIDYVKFFGAGALAATSTHGVSLDPAQSRDTIPL